jgi:two-component system, OmpR family, phosphate regulon sensor histidine kinase PhoR
VDTPDSESMAALIKRSKEALLADWESQIKALPDMQHLDRPALRDHMPDIVDELAQKLEQRSGANRPDSSLLHHDHRLRSGVTIAQVVEEYKALRACIAALAEKSSLHFVGEPHRIVNAIIDDGIKAATEAYFEQWSKDEKRRREEYLTFVVHDLRSPLAAIYNAIHLMEPEIKKIPDNERARTILSAIKRNIERMQALIVKLLQEERNISTPSNIKVNRYTTVLYSIAESTVRTLAPLAAGSGTKVTNQIPRDMVATIDGELIERVFQNLLSNAIEYAPKGAVVIDARTTDDGWLCTISDNGRGMSAEQCAQLFAQPPRSHKHGGRGLGLGVAKRIIEAHGGALNIESEPGKGTTVSITIPDA